MEKGFYLKVIGEGLILLAILSLFCYFTLWAEIGVMVNDIVLIGIAFQIAGVAFLYLSSTITEESLILAILLLLIGATIPKVSPSEIITGALIIVCFSGAIYFAIRRDGKNKTAPPPSVTTE